MRPPLLLALLLLTSTAHAAGKALQTVDATRIAAAARARISALPAPTGTAVQASLVGMPGDAVVPAGKLALRADAPEGAWPRSRVAVPVRVRVAGTTVKTVTVWFAVQASRQVWVVAGDATEGEPASHLTSRMDSVDVARVHGHLVDDPKALGGMRLKHGLRAGSPLLREDFEAIPDVDTQQKVAVMVRLGAIHMQTRGTALSAGNAGQMVSVLAEGAESPVPARVQSKGVVEIAR